MNQPSQNIFKEAVYAHFSFKLSLVNGEGDIL